MTSSPLSDFLTEAEKYTWHPIENAPRDGTPVLGRWCSFGQTMAMQISFRDGWWRDAEGNNYAMSTYFRHLDTPQNDITLKLLEMVKVAVEAMKHYANDKSWYPTDGDADQHSARDRYHDIDAYPMGAMIGADRAKEALAEIEAIAKGGK